MPGQWSSKTLRKFKRRDQLNISEIWGVNHTRYNMTLWTVSCPSFLSISVINTMTESSRRKASAVTLRLVSNLEGNQDRNSRQEPGTAVASHRPHPWRKLAHPPPTAISCNNSSNMAGTSQIPHPSRQILVYSCKSYAYTRTSSINVRILGYLCKSCACTHSLCDFVSVTTLSCLVSIVPL